MKFYEVDDTAFVWVILHSGEPFVLLYAKQKISDDDNPLS